MASRHLAHPADFALMRPLKGNISCKHNRLRASLVTEGCDAIGQFKPNMGDIKHNLAGLNHTSMQGGKEGDA